MDSWGGTSFSVKHAYVEEFVEGIIVNATGFTIALRYMKYPPISNLLYACDLSDGTTIILDHKNTIYMVNDIVESLYNPIQTNLKSLKIG